MSVFEKWPEGYSAPIRVYSKATQRELQEYGDLVQYAMEQVIGYERQAYKKFAEPTCINVSKVDHGTVVVRLVKPTSTNNKPETIMPECSNEVADYHAPETFMDELSSMKGKKHA